VSSNSSDCVGSSSSSHAGVSISSSAVVVVVVVVVTAVTKMWYEKDSWNTECSNTITFQQVTEKVKSDN